MNKEYPDNPQRLAICYSQWKKRKAKASYVVVIPDDEFIYTDELCEECAKRKEPIDSDIEKRNKQASNPPKDTIPNPDKGGPASAPNPDLSNKPSPDQKMDQKWYIGSLVAETDPKTGLAKWPLSFKKIEKDTERPNKPGNPSQEPKHIKKKDDQPPTAA